jgi:hypothetical protein
MVTADDYASLIDPTDPTDPTGVAMPNDGE